MLAQIRIQYSFWNSVRISKEISGTKNTWNSRFKTLKIEKSSYWIVLWHEKALTSQSWWFWSTVFYSSTRSWSWSNNSPLRILFPQTSSISVALSMTLNLASLPRAYWTWMKRRQPTLRTCTAEVLDQTLTLRFCAASSTLKWLSPLLQEISTEIRYWSKTNRSALY